MNLLPKEVWHCPFKKVWKTDLPGRGVGREHFLSLFSVYETMGALSEVVMTGSWHTQSKPGHSIS